MTKRIFKLRNVVAIAICLAATTVFLSCKKDEAPVISIITHPANVTVAEGSITGSLTVVATVTEGATLSYQWYKNTSDSNVGGTAESGATTTSFTIPTSLAEGIYYYFCEVSATGGAAKVRSKAAIVTVTVRQDGTAGYPFLVGSADLFKKAGSGTDGWTLDKHYRQTASFTLSGTWTPIGRSYTNSFTGVYDGDGYSITGLNIPSTSADYQGLFGVIGTGGAVRNVALKDVNININTRHYVGGIAGGNYGLIENCYVTGTVSGNSAVGGVAGSNTGTIKNCYTTCTVTGADSNIGGIAGGNNLYTTIANCYATGNITGSKSVGGIAGCNYSNSSITLCVALNKEVTATDASGSVGRVVGIGTVSTLNNNFARAAGMVLKQGSVTVTLTAGDKGTSTIHGADVLATDSHGATADIWWSSTLSYTNWSVAANRLPWIKTTTSGNFNDAQNPTVD